MKLYKDKELTQIVESLDLGVLEAGKTKQYVYFIYNDTPAELTKIKIEVSHKEVKIVNPIEYLKPNGIGSLVLEWSPSITLKEGLKTELNISASEIYS